MILLKKTIPFYFLIGISILILIGGLTLVVSDPFNSVYVLLSGMGLISWMYAISETEKKRSIILIYASALLFGFASIVFGYTYLQSGRLITAAVFTIAGCSVVAFSAIMLAKKGEYT